jgi:hypothetical protein
MPGKPKLYAHRIQDPQVRDTWRRVALCQRHQAQRQDCARPRLIAGRDEHYREGSDYLEWYEHGK